MRVGEVWIYKLNMLKTSNDIFGEPLQRDDTKVKITRLYEKSGRDTVVFIFLYQYEKENPEEANLNESEMSREHFLKVYERLYV